MMNPSKLTKAEKVHLLALIEEKERRAREKRPPFIPHSGQRRVVESTALERYLFCGNGFGKSTILVNEVHWAATGINPFKTEKFPVPAKIVLLLDSPEKVQDFIAEYRKWNKLEPDQLHKQGKPHVSFISYDNGSTVTILTHAVEPLKLEGSQWTHIFADEPPPKQVFTALFRGGRIKGHPLRVLLAGTPIAAAWLRKDVYDPWSKGLLPDTECFNGTTYENELHLEPGFIERFAAKLSEHEKGIRIGGNFFDLEGLALAHLWTNDTHLISREQLMWDRNNPAVLVFDPHPAKSHHALLVGVDKDNRLYVLEEYKEKALARKFMQSIVKLGWFTTYRIRDIVYDSLGSSEMTSGEGFRTFGEVVNEVLQDAGLGRARATTYDEKSDEDFITRISEALVLPDEADNFGQRVPKLRVVEGLKGITSDILNVQWARDKRLDENKPKLEISNRDFLSCLKYALATNIYFHKTKDKIFHRRGAVYGVNLDERRKAATKVKLSRSSKSSTKSWHDDWDD